MKHLMFVFRSLFSYKRPMTRGPYWLSILVVFLLISAGYFIGEHTRFAYAPEWKQYISLSIIGIGMLLWSSTVVSRMALYEKVRFPKLWLLMVWFPMFNVILTFVIGFLPTTKPGFEEKQNFLEKGMKYILIGLVVFFIVGTILGGIIEFFESDAFETIQLIIGGAITFLIFHRIANSITSGPVTPSSSPRRKNKSRSDAGNSAGQNEVKEVGVYVVNEGGYRDQKIRVYSDGSMFTATSNMKDIEADSFNKLEPMIYSTFKSDPDFKIIDSKLY